MQRLWMDSFCVLRDFTRPIYENKRQGSLQRTRLFPISALTTADLPQRRRVWLRSVQSSKYRFARR